MKFEWEIIDTKAFGYTQRAKVFDGWLVRTIAMTDALPREDQKFDASAMAMSMAFVPDTTHQWVIESDTHDDGC